MKLVYISLGTLSLIIGIIGIVVPGLPTTPFILISASLYLKSSERLYIWLLNTKYPGKYIKDYRKNKGVSMQVKIRSIVIMWAMILLTVFIFINENNLRILIISLGIIGTLAMIKYMPLKKS